MMAQAATGVFMRALLLCLVFLMPACSKQAPEYEVVRQRKGRVIIPLDVINDGGVHHFTFKHEEKNINFFVRTDSAGKLQTHFDACYSCFKYKLGYVREGQKIVCIACRIGYDLKESFWDYIGACAPIPLRSTVEGKYLTIQQRDLQKGGKFF